MTDLNKRSLLKVAALSAPPQRPWWLRQEGRAGTCTRAGPGRRPGAQARAAEDRLRLRRPGGRRRLDLAHDNGRKALEKEFGDKIQTTFVESVPEGRRRARAARPGRPGQQADLRHHLRLHGAMQKVAADFPDVKFEHATGYKTAPTCAPMTAAPTKAPTWPA
jgi:simple sugar transport system substrate-binding protein